MKSILGWISGIARYQTNRVERVVFLLTAVVVIACFAIPRFEKSSDPVWLAKQGRALRVLRSVLENYKMEHGSWPKDIESAMRSFDRNSEAHRLLQTISGEDIRAFVYRPGGGKGRSNEKILVASPGRDLGDRIVSVILLEDGKIQEKSLEKAKFGI